MRSNLCGNPEEIRHELDLHLNLTSAYSRNLPIPNHVHRFISPDRSTRRVETEEAESGINSSFDEPMILLDEVVEVFASSQLSATGEFSFFFAQDTPPVNASFWAERNAPPLSQVKQLWHIVLIGVHLSIKAKFVLAASPGQKLKFTMEEFNRARNTLLKHPWPSLAP